MAWLEEISLSPEWGAKFSTRRSLAKLYDEFAMGLPDYFQAGNFWVGNGNDTPFFVAGHGLEPVPNSIWPANP